MATIYNARSKHPRDMTDAEVLELAARMVQSFLRLLEEERPGQDILDADILPAKREAFESAFRLAIMTEPNQTVRQHLIEAGSQLAHFQEGVGQRVVIRPVQSDSGKNSGPTVTSARLDFLLTEVEADMERLRGMLATADSTAVRRNSAANAGPPFAEDGTYTWYGHRSFH